MNNATTRRTRKNDNYVGKVTFWFDQLLTSLSRPQLAKYTEDRCWDSLAYFTKKAADAFGRDAKLANELLLELHTMDRQSIRLCKESYLAAIRGLEIMTELHEAANGRYENLREAMYMVRELELDYAQTDKA